MEGSHRFGPPEIDLSSDRDRLLAIATEHRDAYARAEPFPHVVVDDFLPPAFLDAVLAEFPPAAAEGWFRFDSDRESKLAAEDGSFLGPATRHLLAELNGSLMLDFLQHLTGIQGLVPDPHFVGGGLHQIERGGFLDVHADFNMHPVTGLFRRLNLLLYLNRDWKPEWNGALELWDASMSEPSRIVVPLFNRCVIFNTSERSLHGHPRPVEAPDGITRKSLALYFYARHPDPDDGSAGAHNTLFQKPNSDEHLDQAADRPRVMARVTREMSPPIVIRILRRLRNAMSGPRRRRP